MPGRQQDEPGKEVSALVMNWIGMRPSMLFVVVGGMVAMLSYLDDKSTGSVKLAK